MSDERIERYPTLDELAERLGLGSLARLEDPVVDHSLALAVVLEDLGDACGCEGCCR